MNLQSKWMIIFVALMSSAIFVTPAQDILGQDYGEIVEDIFFPSVMKDIITKIRHKSICRPDFVTGNLIKEWRPGSGANPEELGSYYEGDIITSDNQASFNSTTYIWPQAVVPFTITGNFSQVELLSIFHAMNEFQVKTCVKFVPATAQHVDYVSVTNEKTGCWSGIGRTGGMQIINLQSPGCVYYAGTILHEFSHTLGLYHVHSRHDRYQHIEIDWKNLKPGAEKNVEMFQENAFDIRYDFASVMHVSPFAFSKNNEPTLLPKVPESWIGQRNMLSSPDVAKVQAMYRCRGPISLL